MDISVGGLTRGLETGMRLRGYQDDRKRQAVQDDRNTKLFDIEMTMKNMQLEDLQDNRIREQVKNDVNATLFHLSNIKEKGQAYIQQAQNDPETMATIQQSMQRLGDYMVNKGVTDGRPRKFKGIVPVDQDNLMFRVDVINPDGTVDKDKPKTQRHSSDPDDKPIVMPKNQLIKQLAMIDALIEQYETELIRAGDTSLMVRAETNRAAGLKRRQEIEDREDKQAHELNKAGIVKAGKGATQGDIQLMEYLLAPRKLPDGTMEKPVATTKEEALRLTKTMKTDPGKGVLELATLLQGASYGKMSVEDALKEAQTLAATYLGGQPAATPTPSPGLTPAPGGLNAPSGEPVQIQSDEDFNQLQPGTRFIGPDGRVRIKP